MKKIDSVQNGRVKQWKKLQTKKERDKANAFLVEGFHVIEEALQAEVVRELIMSEHTDLPTTWDVGDVEIYIVSDAVMKALSETETSQGIFAVCEKTQYNVELVNGKFLLLDGVQDPGNLGTMIRTADAVGLDGVILGEGTADVYNSKVLRSTQGSIFHLPVMKGDLAEWVHRLQEADIPVYGTALQGARPYTEVHHSGGFALIVGNEGNGVRQEILAQTTDNMYIPIFGGAESLNVAVATGVLLYHLRGC